MRVLALTFFLLVSNSVAEAVELPACGDSGSDSLLWTHPAKNATDVPTNALIFALPSQGTPLSVTLESTGQELDPIGTTGIERYLFHPGPLQPGTEYKLILKLGEGSTVAKQQIRFTTGAGELNGAPEGPTVLDYQDWTAAQALSCGQVLMAQACFDGEAERRLLLDLDLDATGIAWTVRQVLSTGGTSDPVLWPGSCVAEAFTLPGESATASTCFELTALDAAGNESEPITLCPFQDTSGSTAGEGGSSSCSVSNESASGAGLVFLFFGGLLVWAYHRRSYPSVWPRR